MPAVVITGYPGFLGSQLLPRILRRLPDDVRAVCLVQQKFHALAQQRRDELGASHPALAARVELVDGDITHERLGLTAPRELADDTIEIHHLAAIYDLAVERSLAMKVNLDGTRQVLDFAGECRNLRRLHYMSTCYVSGRYAGAFSEHDLDKGQTFNNHYEEAKYLAELEVQGRMRAGLPATIYRPSIVVGDSSTGETQKYDGPYFVLQWILRQARYAIMPVVGDVDRTRVNVVPRDYTIGAIDWLGGLEKSLGKVYQLCDPNAPTVREMLDTIQAATQHRIIEVKLPTWLARAALEHVPGVERLLRIPVEMLAYFVHPTYYTCEATLADLEGSGLRCPRFAEYAPRLVRYMRAHPDIQSAAMA